MKKLLAFILVLTINAALGVPQLTFAYACGFGTFSGTGPTVTTDTAGSIATSTARLHGSISDIVGNGDCIGFLTKADSSPWTVPSDWNVSDNSIYAIGPGGKGAISTAGSTGGAGGGGGAIVFVSNYDNGWSPGSTATFQVTGQNTSTSEGDASFNTTFDSSAFVARAGAAASSVTAGAGGVGSTSVVPSGGTKYDGGSGGAVTGGSTRSGAGGGGAGGTTGAGGDGGTTTGSLQGGSGGGGADGGDDGGVGGTNSGGNGGKSGLPGSLGGSSGGISFSATSGTLGAGGGGAFRQAGSTYGDGADGSSGGTQFDATHGSGGGGGGGSGANFGNHSLGGDGGSYGGGGGGGGSGSSENAGGTGGDGLIAIIYTPSGIGSITEHGFAYSTSSTLTTNVSTTTLGAGAAGSFSSGVTGLVSGTIYYYRAYATNNETGTGYGTIKSFRTTGAATRHMRLFKGFKLHIVHGLLRIYRQ